MNWNLKTIIHDSFEVSILIKAVDGALQIIGAILVLAINPARIAGWVYNLTTSELSEDPHDFIASHLVNFVSQYTSHAQWFAAIYLASHGLIKIFLVYCLWRRKLWAYPTAIIVFVLFGVYQMYRYSHTHGIGMIILTVLDAIVIVLTYLEYKQIKANLRTV
jgi:uncharacterized membrane protein